MRNNKCSTNLPLIQYKSTQIFQGGLTGFGLLMYISPRCAIQPPPLSTSSQSMSPAVEMPLAACDDLLQRTPLSPRVIVPSIISLFRVDVTPYLAAEMESPNFTTWAALVWKVLESLWKLPGVFETPGKLLLFIISKKYVVHKCVLSVSFLK